MIFLVTLFFALGGVVAGALLVAVGIIDDPVNGLLWLGFGLTIIFRIAQSIHKHSKERQRTIQRQRENVLAQRAIAAQVAAAHARHFPKKKKACNHRRSFVQRGSVTELLPCDICG